jgi:hypothetical protein
MRNSNCRRGRSTSNAFKRHPKRPFEVSRHSDSKNVPNDNEDGKPILREDYSAPVSCQSHLQSQTPIVSLIECIDN